MSSLPVFSIIIPTYRRASALDSCLESLANLRYPRERFEVIVVDDGSPEPPHEIVARYRSAVPVTLLTEPHQGVSAARNAGAAVARGAYLVFTADDCLPHPDWLAELEAVIDDADVPTAIGGGIDNGCPRNLGAEASHLLIEYLCHRPEASRFRGRFFTPNNLAMPLAAFRSIGGFDTSFTLSTGEDRDICARWAEHGFRLRSVPRARVTHRHPLTLPGFLRMHWRYGRGSGQYRLHRTERTGQGFLAEPLHFYVRLVLYPMKARGLRGLPHSVMLMLSQVASLCGVLAEWWKPPSLRNVQTSGR